MSHDLNWQKSFVRFVPALPTSGLTYISGHSEIDDLYLYKLSRRASAAREMSVRSTNSNGKTVVTGGKDLKHSQHYPIQFLCKRRLHKVIRLYGACKIRSSLCRMTEVWKSAFEASIASQTKLAPKGCILPPCCEAQQEQTGSLKANQQLVEGHGKASAGL